MMEKTAQNVLENNFSKRTNAMVSNNNSNHPYAPASNSFAQSM